MIVYVSRTPRVRRPFRAAAAHQTHKCNLHRQFHISQSHVRADITPHAFPCAPCPQCECRVRIVVPQHYRIKYVRARATLAANAIECKHEIGQQRADGSARSTRPAGPCPNGRLRLNAEKMTCCLYSGTCALFSRVRCLGSVVHTT